MASPQCENGYTKIANELLEALLRLRIGGQEMRVVLYISRKTYGFGKTTDKISYGQIATALGISRRKAIEHVKSLKTKNIVGSAYNGTREPLTLWINKDYEKWTHSAYKVTSAENGTRDSAYKGTKTSAYEGTHKRKKENKEIPSEYFTLSQNFLNHQKKQHGNMVKITDAKIRGGAEAINKLINKDGFSLENDIKPALHWAVEDEFWSTNILSLAGLRKKGSNGEMKFQNLYASYKRKKPKTKKVDLVY